MKSKTGLIFSPEIILPLVACGYNKSVPTDSSKQSYDSNKPATSTDITPTNNQTGSILIAYYSHTGNTEKIANQIHGIVGEDETINSQRDVNEWAPSFGFNEQSNY